MILETDDRHDLSSSPTTDALQRPQTFSRQLINSSNAAHRNGYRSAYQRLREYELTIAVAERWNVLIEKSFVFSLSLADHF